MKLYEIGSRIKALRKDHSFTQAQLAELSGISRVTLGKIERGEMVSVSVGTLDLIISHLGYEIDFRSINNFGLVNLDDHSLTL